MTTTAPAAIVVIGARRAVADELRTLVARLSDAPWPPWTDARVDEAISRLRLTIDQQLERLDGELPEVAARLGLDFATLERVAADPARVQRWVTILTGRATEAEDSNVAALLLGTYLFADELAYIGMLARAIGPHERATAAL